MSDENPTVPAVPAKQTKHGLYVYARPGLQFRDAKVARLKRRLYVECPWLTPADDPMARRFCELQVLIEQVTEIGESRAAERAQRAQESKADG